MLKLKRHLSASSPHSTSTKGATTIIAATIITTIEAATTTTTTGHQHKSDFKAIVDLPSPTNATPPSGPAKGLIVRPFTRYLCVPPSVLAISFLPAPPAAAFGQFPFEWDFSIFHRINILSLSLSFALSFVYLSLPLSLFIFLCFCALCFRRSCCCCGCAPNYQVPSLPCACRLPPFFFFFSFFYVTPHLAFRNVELTFAHKKETYNVEHVLLRFRFFGPDFPPRGKKEEEEEN